MFLTEVHSFKFETRYLENHLISAWKPILCLTQNMFFLKLQLLYSNFILAHSSDCMTLRDFGPLRLETVMLVSLSQAQKCLKRNCYAKTPFPNVKITNFKHLWIQIDAGDSRFNSYIYSDHSCTIINRHSRNTTQTQPSHNSLHNTPRIQPEMYTLIQQTLNSVSRIIHHRHRHHCYYWYSHRIICFSNISLFSKSIKIQMEFSLGWNWWFIHLLAYTGSGGFHW